jgi:hypothetical protein
MTSEATLVNPRPPTKATSRKKAALGNQLPPTAQDSPAALAQPATLTVTVTVTVTVTRVCQSLGIEHSANEAVFRLTSHRQNRR